MATGTSFRRSTSSNFVIFRKLLIPLSHWQSQKLTPSLDGVDIFLLFKSIFNFLLNLNQHKGNKYLWILYLALIKTHQMLSTAYLIYFTKLLRKCRYKGITVAFKGKWQSMTIKSYVLKDKEFNNLEKQSSILITYLIFHTWKKLKILGSVDEDICFGTAIIKSQFCLNTRPIF